MFTCVRARATSHLRAHKPSALAYDIAYCPRTDAPRRAGATSHQRHAQRLTPSDTRRVSPCARRAESRNLTQSQTPNPKPQTPNRNPKPETVQAGGRRAARATRYQPVRGDAPMYIYISDTCKPGQHAISQYEVMHLCCCCWAAADICRYSRHWPSFAALLPFLCVLSLLAH